ESVRWQAVALEVAEIRVQWPLAASDVRWLRTSSVNTDGHRRANSPRVPRALRKAFSALSLINFSSTRRCLSLAPNVHRKDYLGFKVSSMIINLQNNFLGHMTERLPLSAWLRLGAGLHENSHLRRFLSWICPD